MERFFATVGKCAKFVSLQYGATKDELTYVANEFDVQVEYDDTLNIFDNLVDAAALVSAMDYVVTVSQTAAHLAGALGVPGWVLLPAKPFPHRRACTSICPWYPTLVPVRQQTGGCWQPVLENVTEQLRAELDHR